MGRKKILWLCSWYPGRAEPFNGDFVQRHARAASLYHDIQVIHVYADPSGKIRRKEVTTNTSPGLKENIIEFPKQAGILGRFFSYIRLNKTYRHAIRDYIRKEGLPDLVHVNVPIWAGKAGLWMKKKYGSDYLLTEHWAIYNHKAPHNYKSKSAVFKYYSRRIFSEAKVLLSVCDYLARGVNELVTPANHVTIVNTVDTDIFKPLIEEKQGFRFIHISNMEERKNLKGIIRAFALLSENQAGIQLLIVGPANEDLIQYAQSFSGVDIQFTGEISYPDVAEKLRASDALILFSEVENSPCVIGEALCSGIPVISSNVGGIPELVDESNSLLVDPSDEIALKEAMVTMFARKNFFQKLIIADKAAQRFSFRAVGKKISDQYELLTRESSS